MSREALGLVLGCVGVVVFGGSLPFTRLAIEALDPWLVSFGRSAVAGGLAVAVLAATRARWPSGSEWGRLALSSACITVLFPLLTAFALRTVAVSHGGVVLGILPLATAAIGCLLTGERPSWAFWATALAGSAVVVGFALREGGALAPGDGLLLAAVAVSALGYAISARLVQGGFRGWEVISWQLVIALPATGPAFLWLLRDLPPAVPLRSWIGFGYVSLLSQYLGFFAWNAGLALGGIARVSQTQLLQTFVTLGLSALVVGEQVAPSTWGVAALVIMLVVAGQRARGSARPAK